MTKEQFQGEISPTLPHSPGVYRYYDSGRKLLYVGKAKNLKKRVSSYFVKKIDSIKTNTLVTQIVFVEWTVTNDEHDAFLLENSLIKHFKPPYNISLKDDKTYPYITIKNESFPRVYLTRRFVKDGSEYLGPYTAVNQIYTLMDLMKQHFPLRTCNLNLSIENINKGKFKKCLEYHLGNCKAPCEGLQTLEDYLNDVQQVKQIVKGNISGVLSNLKIQMQEEAEQLAFEKAQHTKDTISVLQGFHTKSAVVHNRLGNLDVASIIDQETLAFVNYMVVVDGSIVQSKSLKIEKKLEETKEDLIAYAIAFLRPKFQSQAREIILPFEIQTEESHLQQTIPLGGDKKKLLDLSYKNAEEYMRQSELKTKLHLDKDATKDMNVTLVKLQKDLRLKEVPIHIECFDNSNFQGSFPVAAMVCFKEGLPYKKEYRHFHIKTVEGINDFASMTEIVHRRYARLLKENKPLPQLVIIDGGKGQLSAAMESITALGLLGKMTVVGLAKREESIFFPGDSDPLQLEYNGSSLLLIRRIRDEVHRFGITFHRDIRSKGTIKNELEDIPGIGAQTAMTLLQRYRSVSKIKQMTQRELTMTIGASKARIVYDYFHKEGDA
ncbi:excinuclease ABC subunit C [Taibaiella sp. KBW10]|uniref:excinuclease ABC subunit UvrC n=1 Tax=Taibaiella sp. KBW10 TaxID=2153357 RepID=UPI000F59CBA5|nr:excinuclease ABC subunit UvrC [Taibaiella sp. KBW10]RQO30806.1 excinuclease ABC subunit C [Taibaiella sp. KBW10]